MTKAKALAAIHAAAIQNDRKAFIRIYVENRISLPIANKAWADGRKFVEFVTKRDAYA